MPKRTDRASRSRNARHRARHRFEHWYADNQVYFITARCRDRYPAFAAEQAKAVFWGRFDFYCAEVGFTPWVTSLLDNHYHTLIYVRHGQHLKRFIQRLHGSVAKLVNDQLPARRENFWSDAQGKSYFDGCIRDEKQCRLAYRYTLTQSVRHGLTTDWRTYPHTRVNVELEPGVRRAHELRAFMEGVPYRRYERKDPHR